MIQQTKNGQSKQGKRKCPTFKHILTHLQINKFEHIVLDQMQLTGEHLFDKFY